MLRRCCLLLLAVALLALASCVDEPPAARALSPEEQLAVGVYGIAAWSAPAGAFEEGHKERRLVLKADRSCTFRWWIEKLDCFLLSTGKWSLTEDGLALVFHRYEPDSESTLPAMELAEADWMRRAGTVADGVLRFPEDGQFEYRQGE